MIKFLISIILIVLLFISNNLYGQQWFKYNPTYGFDVNAVEILGPGIIAIGGGWKTNDSVLIMCQTENYGVSWYENAHDGLGPWNKSIAFYDAFNGFGVGSNGWIIDSWDKGRNWDLYATPTTRDLNKIVYAGGGVFYVAGGMKKNDSIQTILKSSNYGNSWNVIYDTLGPCLNSLYFFDYNKGFAVGDNGVILATTDGGDSWSSVTSPLQRDFNSITFINSDTGYIVGGIPFGLCRRTILKTYDGGVNWAVLSDSTGGILKDISFADSLIGYAVGDSATVLKTSDGGSSWLQISADTNLLGNELFNTVKFYDKDFGAIAGKYGLLYVYRDQPVEAYTFGSDSVESTKAILQGYINTHVKNARYSFVYSDNKPFTLCDTTQWVNIHNQTLSLISENIQGLTANTTYYYFLKTITPTDTIYGDTLSFFTGPNPPFELKTLDATSVNTTIAKLNGFIEKFPEVATILFEYGLTPALGSFISANPPTVNNVQAYSVFSNLSSLRMNTKYYFRMKAVTSSWTYYGEVKEFYTFNLPYINNEYAYVYSLDSIQIFGSVNNNGLETAIKFEYGPSTLYGTEVSGVPDSAIGSGYISSTYLMTGISPSTKYHFRLKAVCQNGVSYGDDMTFITGEPVAITSHVSEIGNNSVKLNGFVNPRSFPTSVKFQYGLTSLYGNEVNAVPDSASGLSSVDASYLLSGLTPATTYHYRIVASSMVGTSYGADSSFTVGFPAVTTFAAVNLSSISAQLNGIVNANGFPTANKFEYGTTTAYGNEIAAIPDSSFGITNLNISATIYGLLQNTTYHFRAVASNSIGTSYGYDFTFTTGAPSVLTLPATILDENSVRLNGIVNACNSPTSNVFEWGSTTIYGNQFIAIPDSITGNNDVTISYTMLGMQPSTTYYYRVKATNLIGTTYGNDISFTTGGLMVVNTMAATDITTVSAMVSGSINTGGIPAAVKFEYGLTPSYGSEINAVPDSSSVFGIVNVYAILNGLMPNTTYHYRLKGQNSTLTKYGTDKIFYTGPPEIPNFDFELWTPDTVLNPEGWNFTAGRITRYTPACHYNSAVKIENDSNGLEPGVILIGNTNQGQYFTGGVPFNARPDTLIGCFNYDIPINDTALIGLILKKQGIIISESWFEIYGNSSGNYTDLKFPISYNSTGNADSLIMGIVSTDFRKVTPPQLYMVGGFLIVDNLRFTGTTENIPNNDFENWVTDTAYILSNWHYDKKDDMHPSVSRTTDAQHGDYAVIIQNYLATDTHGSLTTSSRWHGPDFSVIARHQSLTGFYKFFPENNDTMNVSVFMFKNHIMVGAGYFQTTTPIASYSPFSINLFYNDTVVPDSCRIHILSYSNNIMGNSRLYVDNLNFDGFLSVIKENAIVATDNFGFNVYPNPFSEYATVSFSLNQDEDVIVRLFDISGKQIAILANGRYKIGEYKINLSSAGLGKGFYICVINTKNKVSNKKLIIY
jgi:photosystem II stability/assembly factor-like uncharacterized protein